MSEGKKRINFDVPIELAERIERMPWGARAAVMRVLLEWACDLHEQHGEIGLGAILAKRFQLSSDAILAK